jgi:hypothetical protein
MKHFLSNVDILSLPTFPVFICLPAPRVFLSPRKLAKTGPNQHYLDDVV